MEPIDASLSQALTAALQDGLTHLQDIERRLRRGLISQTEYAEGLAMAMSDVRGAIYTLIEPTINTLAGI